MKKRGEITINYLIFLIIGLIALIVIVIIFKTQIAAIFGGLGDLIKNIFSPVESINFTN
tara:strand:+ start:359 stop:535 length:177 start_codon:yes stop_codon:yes gene_type:complete